MFAGRRRRSSNIRLMQLFHELKQQFPTVPDHVVTACIATSAHSNLPDKDSTIREILEAAASLNNQQEPMGRPPPQSSDTPSLDTFPINANPPAINDSPESSLSTEDPYKATTTASNERKRFEMNSDSVSDDDDRNDDVKAGVTFSKKFESVNVNTSKKRVAKSTTGKSTFFVKRPDHLDINSETVEFSKKQQPFSFSGNGGQDETCSPSRLINIQPSEKCKDVHKLLNSDNVSDKPPRSPLTSKRLLNSARSSPTRCDQQCAFRSPVASPDTHKKLSPDEQPKKKGTASTPTQTTGTLLGGSPSVNLSLNVNCSMDVVQSPTSKRTSILHVTPQQPWLQEPVSPRSYTSVNLTLRPPSSEPRSPIDITSQNSSLTYSTSSFDSQKGLQSRLQITVGPGGGSVSSVRTRPRSSYIPDTNMEEVVPARAGSLNNLATTNEDSA